MASVSLTRQQAEDGSSLDSQEVACRRLAASQGFTITQVFKEDFPGTELARPLQDQLRSGVKSGAYAAVFCYATDRLSRSPVHLALIAEQCQKCEVELVFVTEGLDSSPEGQLLTFVRGWAAQLEREKIKDRTIRGKAARIASGRLPQGTGRTGTAYGYRYDKATGRRVIEPSEALVITELFELCATGLSTYKLAERLNGAELPSPLGTKWHPRTVLNILRNPIYMGVTYFNRRQRVHISGKRHTYIDRPQSEWAVIDGATPAIVDADLFRTAQARLDQPLKMLMRAVRAALLIYADHLMYRHVGLREPQFALANCGSEFPAGRRVLSRELEFGVVCMPATPDASR